MSRNPLSAPLGLGVNHSISLTQILLGANVAVFLAMAIGSGSVMDFPGHALLFGANYGP